MKSSPYGFVIETDFGRYFPYGVAVHQFQIEHAPVGFIMDKFHDKIFDLSIAVLRAYVRLWHWRSLQ